MNEELDSQLSAMFDNELPPAECELLARRLSRDEQLKARWGRYAAIGATIRAEGGTRLDANLALRVRAVVSREPLLAAPLDKSRPASLVWRWWRPVASGAVAASVAAASILWLRFEALPVSDVLVAGTGSPQRASAPTAIGETSVPVAESYVVPKSPVPRSSVPMTQLANYVVAHSEFSSPVNRRSLLTALMVNESGAAGMPAGSDEPSVGSEESSEDAGDDAKNPQ